MLILQYHNILINVKKKYYMWYMPPVQLVFETLSLDRNRKNRKAGGQNLQKLQIMGFILCFLCLW